MKFFTEVATITGFMVLFVLTLGKWDIDKGRFSVATGVGALFWVVVGVVVWIAFFR